MAKMTKCAICGKEIKKGFFSEESETLSFTLDVSITCCKECEETFRDAEVFDHERFGRKIYNYQKNTKRKLTDAEIGHMFLQYTSDMQNHILKTDCDRYVGFCGFCYCDEDGNFAVKEHQLGFRSRDIGIIDMVVSKANNMLCHDVFFDKNDITKIAYRRKKLGDPRGPFGAAYSYDIILNDENTFTYKPGMSRASTIGHGLPFLWFFSADKKIRKMLEEFKQAIGSDLPIEKAK